MSDQPDGNTVITVDVTANHIYDCSPNSAIDWAMAKALRDAGFKNVTVEMSVILLNGRKYEVDAHLVQWQQDAIKFDPEGNDDGNGNGNGNGEGMTPMTMQLDFERRSVRFLKTLPWTAWSRTGNGEGWRFPNMGDGGMWCERERRFTLTFALANIEMYVKRFPEEPEKKEKQWATNRMETR